MDFEVNEGGLLIFPPSIPYRLEAGKCGKSNHVIVNFDLVSDNRGAPTVAPSAPEEYDESLIYSRQTFEPFDGVFHLEKAHFCLEALTEMCKEMREQRAGCEEILSGSLKCLLMRAARGSLDGDRRYADGADGLCRRVKEYIGMKCLDRINNENIAKHFGYHPYYLNSLFKRVTGRTVHSYLLERRLSSAKDFLLTTELSVGEIGVRCGFCSPSYFVEVFSAQYGMTPREYRLKAK